MAFGHGVVRIAIGGGEHADVHLLLNARAQAAELALFQHAQQLGLGAGGHLADLVEQQRAALGQLEAAGAPLDRAGECAFFMAEDLALDQRLGNGRAVDGNKGVGLARAQVVERARHQFLAGAAFAGDEDGDVGGGDLLDETEDFAHGAGTADHGAEDAGFAEAAARHFKLDLGFALAGGVGQDGAQAGGVNRFLEEVVSAQLHGVDGQLNGAHGGEDHHGEVRVESRALLSQLGQQADAIQTRHLQVGDDDGRVPGKRFLPALDAVARRLRPVAPAGDQLRESHQRVGFVFDNQDLYAVLH